MAKQTFTTGQVLSAAQMTSLQQTAMGGGSATAKTSSYVLVAADAGTTVAMNAAGATTITVNTGLFAAGDTVFIQNLGAGACTVTAGTATVATAGSLILPQNDAGILYFTAAGASIFYDFIQAGAVSPLTTKGDVYTFSTSDARLGVGANDTVLTADSAQATGLKWATAAGASTSYALLNSGGTALTAAATITVSGLSSFNKFFVIVDQAGSASASSTISLQFNSDSGSNYNVFGQRINLNSPIANTDFTRASFALSNYRLLALSSDAGSTGSGYAFIDGAKTTGLKMITSVGAASPVSGSANQSYYLGGYWNNTAAISSISILSSAGNFNAGTLFIYGAN